ncbi:hypothetical protein ACOSP7_006691 [Xanthoceras sorbifolium]
MKFTEGFVNRSALWCLHPQSCVKLNVDGNLNFLGCIAAGGVIQDSNGQWLEALAVPWMRKFEAWEAHKLADWMAKLGQHNELGVKVFEDPLIGCLEIIKADVYG